MPDGRGVRVMLGGGRGSFEAPIEFSAQVPCCGGTASWEPVVADFNGDEKPDAAVTLSTASGSLIDACGAGCWPALGAPPVGSSRPASSVSFASAPSNATAATTSKVRKIDPKIVSLPISVAQRRAWLPIL